MIMSSYLKSEIYRLVHSKGTYIFIACCTAVVVLLEVLLAVFPTQYTTTKYAFSSMFSNLGVVMMLCLSIVSVVFAEESKNHTLKNAVAYGISRSDIFFGRLMAELLLAIISFVIVIGAYIAGGYMLLANSGQIYLTELITGMAGAIPILILCVVFTHALYYIVDNEITLSVIWFVIIFAIPKIIGLLGMKVEAAAAIAKWMPWFIITDVGSDTETGAFIIGWLTQDGMMRCLLVGIIGSIVFYIIGLAALNKKEIK